MKKLLVLLITIASLNANGQTLEWARSMGGSDNDLAYSIATNDSGSVYVTGVFRGTVDFDPGAGIFNLTSNGGDDIFIQKLDLSGNLLWAVSFGGTSNDAGYEISLSDNGSIYITGCFRNTVDFDPGAGIFNITANTSTDIFILKLDSSGNLTWVKAMGGADFDYGYSITTDAIGNVYVTGSFGNTVDFDPGGGTLDLTSNGSDDTFVQKLDVNGNLLWVKSLGGTGMDIGNTVTVDDNGNLYVAGRFENTVDFDPGSGTFNINAVGGSDIFVQKLDANGDLLWVKSMGGNEDDTGNSIVTDAIGNVCLTGSFRSSVDFDPGSSTVNLTSNGAYDIFVQKLDSNGNLLWIKAMGGNSIDYGNAICTDYSGNIYLTGSFYNTVDFDPGSGTHDLISNGLNDIFVQKLDVSGNLLWVKSMGNSTQEYGKSIAADAGGNIYTTGSYFDNTVDFDPGSGTVNLTSNGAYDIFVQKFSQSTSCLGTNAGPDQTVCSGDSVTLTAMSGNSYTVDVSASGAMDYDFTGDFSGADPNINITLGDTLTFNVNTSGHPFWINTVQGTGSSNGVSVTNNGTSSGTIVWAPTTAGTFYYNCEFHSMMTGVITVSPPTTTFTWDNGVTNNVPFLPSETSDYILTATDMGGCTAYFTVTVSISNTDIEQGDTTICLGDSMDLNINNLIGGSLVDTFDMTFTSAFSHTIPATVSGGIYYIVVEGTYWGSTGELRDAAFKFQDNNQPFGPNSSSMWKLDGSGPGKPCPAAYTTDHKYYFYFSGTGSGVTFTFDDSNYSDNGGNLSFDIYYLDGGVLWSNGDTASCITVSPTITTTYSVAVSDGIGTCTDSVTISVSNLSVAASGTNVTCNGSVDGTVTAAITGGQSPYLYIWSTGDTIPSTLNTNTISNLNGGTYVVEITDALGCTDIDSVVVDEAPAISDTAVATNVSCFGGSDGSINLTVTGGVPPYTYLWVPGSDTTEDISGLTSNVYSYIVLDAYNCVRSGNILVDQPLPLQLSAGITDVTCYGMADGSIDLTVTGGSGPYVYSWSNGISTEDLTSLSAGTYVILVTDSNGCQDSLSASVNESVSLVLSIASTNVTCNGAGDGTATATATGGQPPYAYSWNTGESTSNLDSVGGGTYTVIATDSMGCTATDSVVVDEAPAISDTAVATNVSCFGGSDGSIDLTVTGGALPYTFLWAPGTDTTEDLSGLPFGVYTYVVIDANLCPIVGNVFVDQPMPLTILQNTTDVTCNGGSDGSITLTIMGGTPPCNVFWSNGDTGTSISNLIAGVYIATITDLNGCTVTDSIVISEPTALVLSTAVSGVSCNDGTDGSIDLTVSGGTTPYGYSWSNGENTEDISNLSAGTYTVVVTDGNGCVDSASVLLGDPNVMNLAVLLGHVTCHGWSDGSIDLNVNGGTSPYGYSWSNGDTTQDLSGVPAATYSVTVTDDNGCTDTLTSVITEPSEIVTGTISGATQANIGTTEPYSVTGNTGSTYTWTVTNGTISSGQGGVQIEVLWPSSPGNGQVAVVEMTQDSCYGDTVYLNVTIVGEAVGITTVTQPLDLLIYPNPFTNTTKVVFTNPEGLDYTLTAYDVTGNAVRVIKDIKGEEVVFNREDLTPGVYFIELSGNGPLYRGRLLVE